MKILKRTRAVLLLVTVPASLMTILYHFNVLGFFMAFIFLIFIKFSIALIIIYLVLFFIGGIIYLTEEIRN